MYYSDTSYKNYHILKVTLPFNPNCSQNYRGHKITHVDGNLQPHLRLWAEGDCRGRQGNDKMVTTKTLGFQGLVARYRGQHDGGGDDAAADWLKCSGSIWSSSLSLGPPGFSFLHGALRYWRIA